MNNQNLWPVYKGASFNIWEPDTKTHYAYADPQLLLDHLFEKRLRQSVTSSSPYFGTDPVWHNDPSTLPCLFPRVAYRRTTGYTNKRTTIACLIPPNVFLVDSAAFILFAPCSPAQEAYLLGLLCSVPFDWYSRRVVELNLSFAILNSCPIPKPPVNNPIRNRVIYLAGRLAAVDDRYEDWASQVGVSVASVKSEVEKADLIAELDAAVALLYGLDESDIQIIYRTFHTTTDHLPKIDAVLSHYRNLQNA